MAKNNINPICTAVIAAGLASILSFYINSKYEPKIKKCDLTSDGIQDILIHDPDNQSSIVFIGKYDGSFEKAEVVMQDRVPFYQTEKGYYDPWGNYFENKLEGEKLMEKK
jgi:hypothetical protein